MFQTEDAVEKVVLIAVSSEDDSRVQANLDELALLVDTSGAVEAGRLTQKRDGVHPQHYMGSGKIEELRDLISLVGADAIVSDDELSNSQQRTMSNLLNVKILDRSMVILDIFAGRASTAEGKTQVELAQLKYRLTHLSGIGTQMSRLGGGIGTRGPGEKKLETDRRYIRERITQLNRELAEISEQRTLLRANRRESGIISVSMVGYTNAGKSTLMNAITEAGVFAEDKLFATLDTTTRKTPLPDGGDILLTDTVGFIQKLPHNLIQAFKATLEELKDADMLLHIVDASNPERESQMKVVYETLEELGCVDKPIITVYNKADLDVQLPLPHDKKAFAAVNVSAKSGLNINELLLKIAEAIKLFRKKMDVLIPYAKGGLVQMIHDRSEILSEEYREEGTLISAYLDSEMENRLKEYAIKV
ncbi:MAG: GTPase HflX [Clostridiales bacterium]|jgi:GTP-binding protein HflX|nr:GTPase HflX [Clostridiales bacterium]